MLRSFCICSLTSFTFLKTPVLVFPFVSINSLIVLVLKLDLPKIVGKINLAPVKNTAVAAASINAYFIDALAA